MNALAGGVRLDANVTINTDAGSSGAGGPVNFNDTNINATAAGAQSLTIQAPAAAVNLENVGATTSLSSLVVNPSGSINIDGSVVTTGAVQLIANNAVNVNGINAGAGTIEIRANQDGAGGEDFTQASGTIQTTNAGAAAIGIFVNTAAGGTGDASIRTLVAPTGTVSIRTDDGITDADGGAVLDANFVANNVTAINLTIVSATGFEVDTTVANVTASNTGIGLALLFETDDITLVSVTNNDGRILATAGGNVIATNVAVATDADVNDIELFAGGNLTVGTITAGGGGAADVRLSADSDNNFTGSVLDDANNGTRVTGHEVSISGVDIGAAGANNEIDTTAGTLVADSTNLAAGSHGIWIGEQDAVTIISAVTDNGVIVIDAGGQMTAQLVTAVGLGRNVRLTTTAGDIAVEQVAANTTDGIVRLNAAGAVTEGDTVVDNVDITAHQLSISAGAGVGSPVFAVPNLTIETNVDNIAAATGTGDFLVTNNGALVVTSVTAFGVTVTGITGDGAMDLTATSPLTAAANIVMGGDIELEAGEINDAGLWLDDLTVNAGITVQSTGGSIHLCAGDDIFLNAGSIIQAATNVSIEPACNDLDGQGDLTFLGTIIAGEDVDICVMNDLTLGTIEAGETVTLVSQTGAILDGTAGGPDITATALAMLASTGIGVGANGGIRDGDRPPRGRD